MTARARHTVFAVAPRAGRRARSARTAPRSRGAAARRPDAGADRGRPAPPPSSRPRQSAHRPTTYWFEVGTTLAYGTTTTSASAGKGDKPVAVTHDRGPAAGDDVPRARRGLQRPRRHAGRRRDLHDARREPQARGALPDARRPGAAAGTELVPAPRPPPVLGRSVAVAPASGSGPRARPGRDQPAALVDGASVPVGSIVDTRAGTVTLPDRAAGRRDPDRAPSTAASSRSASPPAATA
jgi:hypothetical protein